MNEPNATPTTEPRSEPPAIREQVIEVLRTVYDPEIPVNIYEMGLIYEVSEQEEGDIYIKMTLTSPMCPVAETLPPEVEAKAAGIPAVRSVKLDLVWDPPWELGMMSEAARLELGM